jgi:hypothetical protein
MIEKLPLTIVKTEYILPARFRVPGFALSSQGFEHQGAKNLVTWGRIVAIKITVKALEPLKFKFEPFPKRDLDVEASVRYPSKERAVFTFRGDEITEVLTELSSRISPRPLRQKPPAIQPRLGLEHLREKLLEYIMDLER